MTEPKKASQKEVDKALAFFRNWASQFDLTDVFKRDGNYYYNCTTGHKIEIPQYVLKIMDRL